MENEKRKFNTIEEAIEALQAGHIIIVTDDPDRENEGDFICAAQYCTTENMNFMAMHGKGLICMPMSIEYAHKLGLPPMVSENTDNHETAFTVSIDHVDTTTGISAVERALTARKCTEESAKPEDFRRPGHNFPLIAKRGGVLTRNGHTEATVDLMRLAGLKQVGLCCEIMADDGTMMRTPQLWDIADQYGLKFITIHDLQNYCRRHDKHVVREAVAKMPTKYARHHAGLCAHPVAGAALCVSRNPLFSSYRTRALCHANGGFGWRGCQTHGASPQRCTAGGVGFAVIHDGSHRGRSESVFV